MLEITKTLPSGCFNNVYSFNDDHNRDVLLKHLSNLLQFMKSHYGPNCYNAVLDYPMSPLAEPQFTSDGINILSAYRTDDVMMAFLLKLYSYIGRRIANIIGDGTTTGILIAILLTEQMLKEDKLKLLLADQLTYNEFRVAFKEFLELYRKQVKQHSFQAEDDGAEESDRIKAIVAYHQSMTSSHGDKELSAVISQLVSRLPNDLLSSISYTQLGRETVDRLAIKEEEAQYSCEADVMNTAMLHMEGNTAFYSPAAKVFISMGGLMDGDISFREVFEVLKEAFENKQDLVILYASSSGEARGMLYNTIREYQEQYNDYTTRIAAFLLPQVFPNYNDLINIALIGDQRTISSNKVVYLNKVSVLYRKGELFLENLYTQHVRPGYHPRIRKHVGDNAYPEFNRTLADIEVALDRYREINTDGTKTKAVIELARLRNRLLLDRRVSLVIGGKGYENTALLDVVEDCVKACKKSIETGCTYGACLTSIMALREMLLLYKNKEPNSPVMVIAEVVLEVFLELRDLLIHHKPIVGQDTPLYLAIKELIVAADQPDGLYPDEHLIIQPTDTEPEILERVEEVIVKLFYNWELVVQNG